MVYKKNYMPDGFRSVTPYLVTPGAARLFDFLLAAFGAEARERVAREDGSIAHAAVKIGDSIVEMGEAQDGRAMLASLHLYVADADATYQWAIAAHGTSLYAPQDMDYGDREAGVADPSGNHWYIGTHKAGKHFVPDGLGTVTAGFRVKGAAKLLEFLLKAFPAEVVEKHEANGVVGHAKVRIGGDSIVECSEAHGEWGPRTVAMHVYVPKVDTVYKTALAAGASSLSEPRDQFYGERSGGVIDAWGNHWYIATKTEDLSTEELQARAAAQGESMK